LALDHFLQGEALLGQVFLHDFETLLHVLSLDLVLDLLIHEFAHLSDLHVLLAHLLTLGNERIRVTWHAFRLIRQSQQFVCDFKRFEHLATTDTYLIVNGLGFIFMPKLLRSACLLLLFF